jgi:Icc-related predicted phosphoesterase
MRIFAAGDFHKSAELQEAVVEQVTTNDYDLVILTGDYEEVEYYEALVDDLTTPFIALTGNWDFGFEPPENGEYTNLFNYKEVVFEDYHVALLGAVYPDDFPARIADFFADVPRHRRIIASHYPPHMLGDLTDMGTRAGFTEFRELIMKEKPAVWLCGHIHEDFGEFELLKTTVLNCASKESGKAWAFDLTADGVTGLDEVVLSDS